MKKEEYDKYNKMDSASLFVFLTESDESERKWVAMQILEQRRIKPLVDAAKESAKAAKRSATSAFISAIIALFALLLSIYIVSLDNGQPEFEPTQKNPSSAIQHP